jgi:L-erythro-3,5-diaminohexanoate dehydrogenase
MDLEGGLPQPAFHLDNDFSHLFVGETLIAVETLNIDAASYAQMEEEGRGEGVGEHALATFVGRRVLRTVWERGKAHNLVTGSGGMLLGRVVQNAGRPGPALEAGSRIATLASLSLTPLRIDRVMGVRPRSCQVDVVGEALVFASAPLARLPVDLPERLALAILDVAGAAPQVARLVRPGSRVVILGAGGKSGILCSAEARRKGGPGAVLVGVESHPPAADELRQLGLCDHVLDIDARDALAVRHGVLEVTGGYEADLALSCVNVNDAEMSAILVTRPRGVAYFFAMSTSFPKAALGAEGVGKDIDLFVGNGYAEGHADHTLHLVRSMPAIRALFERRYA